MQVCAENLSAPAATAGCGTGGRVIEVRALAPSSSAAYWGTDVHIHIAGQSSGSRSTSSAVGHPGSAARESSGAADSPPWVAEVSLQVHT